MSFANIKGQDSAIDFIKSSIGSGRVSCAYIFAGPSGIGKKLTALAFAKALNCLGPSKGEGCDACLQCKKIEARSHPDVILFSPAKEDSSLGIDRIRALTKDIGLKPYEARRKVYILDSADSMTQEAQNALLKTLEEPPSESVLILIAENINAIFSTIQSRAKIVRFFPLAPGEIKEILMNEYKLDEKRSQVLSRLSSGELGKALKYNEDGFFQKRDRLLNALKGGLLFDPDFDNLSKSDLRLVLDIMLTWYRDILVAKAGAGASSALVNADKVGLIHDEANRSSFEALNNIISQIILTGSFLDQNINPKLAMGVLGVKLRITDK